MAKQNKPKKIAERKTLMEKIGDTAAHLKEELIAGKDHLVEVAGDAFDSVKSSIQHLTEKKKKPKKAAKAASKKAVTKKAKPAPKKAAKAAVKKAAAPVAKPSKPVVKKAAPKKAAKKAAAKKKK